MKLIAFDLDGTLLTTEKELTDENLAALERAAEAGIVLVPATGRFFGVIPENVRSLPWVRYFITINGAQVWDAQESRSLLRAEIPAELALRCCEHMDGLPVIYDCYQDGWGWMTQAFYDKADRFAANIHSLEMIRNLRTPVPELKACLKERARDVQKIQIFFRDMELRANVLQSLPEAFPDLVVTTSIVNNIEINSREATKGNALEKLAACLGIPVAQTMAFGDDRNDLSMLQTAGIGVAMGNAEEEVRLAADYVTEDCNDSGVAHALKHFLWENES